MNKRTLRVGVVIVSYGHEKYLTNLVKLLRKQMQVGDKIVVVDNHPNRNTYNLVNNNKDVDFAIPADNNGFAAGCNVGAGKIVKSVDILFFVNPDTTPKKGVIDVIRNADYSKYAAVMPLLVLPDNTVNSTGNIMHISGLSWSDGYGKSVSEFKTDQEVSILSGACMATTVTWWKKVGGGIPESYFLYYEDIDFCTLILLKGGKLGLLPEGQIEHDYDYNKGSYKWLYIERNRPLYILRTWPLSVILVLFIQLLFVGIGLWIVAIIQKRFKSKVKAFWMAIKAIPATMRQRHAIQKGRKISGYEFLKKMSYKLDTPMLGRLGSNKLITAIYFAYYKLCLGVLWLFK